MQPGKSTAAGQHWVYRLEGHRKCWFQAAEGTAAVKKLLQHHAARQPVIAPENNEAGLRKKGVVDARAQLLRSAPAEAHQPTPPAPEVVDAAPAGGSVTLVPPAPVVAEPMVDQLTPDHPAPRPVDVEKLLAAATFASDMSASSVPLAAPGTLPDRDAGEDGWEWMASQAGMALMALGLVSLLGSLLASRFLNPSVGANRRTWSLQTEGGPNSLIASRPDYLLTHGDAAGAGRPNRQRLI